MNIDETKIVQGDIEGFSKCDNREEIDKKCRNLCDALPLKPVSNCFGYDRGTPIDRYYIEKFLSVNKSHIKGDVLEVGESYYTRKFGNKHNVNAMILGDKVKDIQATVIKGDLSTGVGIVENIADCFIMTQTLNYIFDLHSAVKNALKLIRPGGKILTTVSGICQISRWDYDQWGQFWSFTDLSLRRIFEQVVPIENISITSFGNVKISASFLYGLTYQDMNIDDYEYVDNDFQQTICAVVEK